MQYGEVDEKGTTNDEEQKKRVLFLEASDPSQHDCKFSINYRTMMRRAVQRLLPN